ncbi:MAG: hypothetical protein QXE81_02180 [Desulfurococcaceae archaeon]
MHKVIKISGDKLLEEISVLIDKARERGIVIRAMGAVAVYYHLKNSGNELCIKFYETMGRLQAGEIKFTDVDFVAYKRNRNAIEKFFLELGFKPDEYINAFFSDKRFTFHHAQSNYTVDVFFTPLEFSHIVDLEGRLELHPYTLTPTDLLLLKLQIHDINRKDLGDAAALLACIDLSHEEKPYVINIDRVVNILTDDWGFWYDAVINLNKLPGLVESVMKDQPSAMIQLANSTLGKINQLIKTLDEAPKSDKWLKRAKIGTKKRWYNVVEEI